MIQFLHNYYYSFVDFVKHKLLKKLDYSDCNFN